MLDTLFLIPGRLFVIAAFLPALAALLMILAGTLRNLSRPHVKSSSLAAFAYKLLGEEKPTKLGGWFVFAFMALSAISANAGLLRYLGDLEQASERTDGEMYLQQRWCEQVNWLSIASTPAARPATALKIGYHVDKLSASMMAMVTFVASLIVLFSIGYMKDESESRTVDHEVDVPQHPHDAHHTHEVHHHGHGYERRGRFGRFFTYLALFVFSMMNLLLADNLFQIFVGWESVGVCSFLLIGFYYERPSASTAANKAFLMNRIGDAGFLVGIGIAWSVFGTLDVQELILKIAHPPESLTSELWTLMGLGIFLGCVGKSAQFPLHTWLPDAMEGPTPVSALIHAATMVAAGVYLVGRCFPLFSTDVLLVIAYTGMITLFLAATIASVQTDIKRVLAYSTVSQLGYMMLALGLGAWHAAILHLIAHAFFKALLFLGSGSVIHGMHHIQDMRRMGGLARKMPVTARTMLLGVCAISGVPMLSGWYGKDMILSAAIGEALAEPSHALLFFVPLLTAGLTAYYMFRLWFMTFSGVPRDPEAVEKAHESPFEMTGPLILLALFSLGIAWGLPPWNAEKSALGHWLHESAPAAHSAHFAHAREKAEEHHLVAGGFALLVAALGGVTAYRKFGIAPVERASPVPAERGGSGFLANKWYFDELYDTLVRWPVVRLAFLIAGFDKKPPRDGDRPDPRSFDGLIDNLGGSLVPLGDLLRKAQSGSLRAYVLIVSVSLVGVLGLWAVMRAG